MNRAKKAFIDKFTLMGDSESGFCGTISDVGCTGAEVGLRKCRFCKGTQQNVMNTITDSYWIECACGIELHSSSTLDDGSAYSDLECHGSFNSADDCRKSHEAAFTHIINKWNTLGSA